MCLEFKLNCSCFTVYVVLECYCQWQGLRLKFWIVVFEIYVLSMTVIINYLECVYQSADLRMSWKTETLPKNIHDDMHRQAQQPFFRVIGHSRRFAWSWGRRGRHQTWVVRSMSQQVKNSTSEKQCVTSTSQWQDKTRTGHEQNKTKQSMTGHANMVNDNMHTHTHTHVFSRQLQFCFPVQVHLLLWDKG